MIRKKSLRFKITGVMLYLQKGAVLNRFYSLLSPQEYSNSNSTSNEYLVKRTLFLLAPNRYTGKLQRYGGIGDGSYVVPVEFINKNSYLISAGIEDNNKFEVELAENGVTGLQIDNSITQPPIDHRNLSFESKTLCGTDSQDSISLNKLIERAPKNKRLLIKLDVEGAEIDSLLSISRKNFTRIDCLVMELHNLSEIVCKDSAIFQCLNKINDLGLVSIYVQANNACSSYILSGNLLPENLELTFVKKSKTISPNLIYIKKIKNYISLNSKNFSTLNIDHILLGKILYNDSSELVQNGEIVE
jgi:hypothetical protein